MTVLSIAQTCAKRLQLASPSGLIASTDNNIVLLLQMIEQAAQEIRNEFPWMELQDQYSFTLADGTDAYALPGDIDRIQHETLWNSTQQWPLVGPLDPVEWQNYTAGLLADPAGQRFRIKGWASNQFFIQPTPSSEENGQVCVFEYITKTLFRPKTWVTSTSFAAGSYCSYNGNIYKTTAGGTTGATPPTHTTGSASDGTVTWTYQTAYFQTIVADTDECLLDNQVVIDGAIWRFKRERGLFYEELKQEALRTIELTKPKLLSAEVLSVRNPNRGVSPLGLRNYPEQNF